MEYNIVLQYNIINKRSDLTEARSDHHSTLIIGAAVAVAVVVRQKNTYTNM